MLAVKWDVGTAEKHKEKKLEDFFWFYVGNTTNFCFFCNSLCVCMIVWNVLKATREFTESREKLTRSRRGRFQCHPKLWAWFYYHSSVCAVCQRVFRNITAIKRNFICLSVEVIPSHKCLLCLHCIVSFWRSSFYIIVNPQKNIYYFWNVKCGVHFEYWILIACFYY